MSGLDDVLDSLIAGHWILTLEDSPDGTQQVVAQRPVGWDGPGDPYERVVADDHARLLRRLIERQNSEENNGPEDVVRRP